MQCSFFFTFGMLFCNCSSLLFNGLSRAFTLRPGGHGNHPQYGLITAVQIAFLPRYRAGPIPDMVCSICLLCLDIAFRIKSCSPLISSPFGAQRALLIWLSCCLSSVYALSTVGCSARLLRLCSSPYRRLAMIWALVGRGRMNWSSNRILLLTQPRQARSITPSIRVDCPSSLTLLWLKFVPYVAVGNNTAWRMYHIVIAYECLSFIHSFYSSWARKIAA